MFSGSLNAQTISHEEAHKKAESLLKQMTLDEKVGQMNESSGVQMPMLGNEKPDDLIAQGRVGSILWLIDVKEINRLQHIAVDKSRLHIPILFGFDVIHGYRTVFPVPLAMASSWDPSVEEQAQHLAGQDARAAGIQLIFTPMVDIARDARWGRIVEGAGEDPYLGAAMARAQVRGFQGDTLGPDSVMVCVKHYAGYGAAEGGRDYDSSYVPEELMRECVFEAVPRGGAGGRGQLHERLHGLERRAGERQQVAADGRAAQRLGVQGLCVVGCVCGGQPGDARVCTRSRGCCATRQPTRD